MLTLTCTYTGLVPLEADAIAPDRLAPLSLAEVAALPVHHGNTPAQLVDFFAVAGDPSDGDLLIEGDCSRVKWLGAGMASGRLTVRGSVGTHLASGMTGGTVHVHGDADDWCAAEMRGGLVHVHGNASDKVGAAYPGSRKGMRGGVLLIDGDAGDDLAAAMRRGTVVVGGRTGAFPAAAVIAGTVLAFGPLGANPGAGLKRGTVLAFGGQPELLPTFDYDCTHRPQFVTLYLRHLLGLGFAVPGGCFDGQFDRYRGDAVTVGKGEVLVWRLA